MGNPGYRMRRQDISTCESQIERLQRKLDEARHNLIEMDDDLHTHILTNDALMRNLRDLRNSLASLLQGPSHDPFVLYTNPE